MPLVRLGQTYSLDELPIRHNDNAVAAELVFCLWVRRRDPHAWNRVYVQGVPMFFDQHVSFDQRPLDEFFVMGPDGSHPPRWRVRTFETSEGAPFTQGERDAARPLAHEIGLHRVRSVTAFNEAFDATADHIEKLDADWISHQVQIAGAPAGLPTFLERTRAELPAAIARLRGTLYA
jgi:hypothetical protein